MFRTTGYEFECPLCGGRFSEQDAAEYGDLCFCNSCADRISSLNLIHEDCDEVYLPYVSDEKCGRCITFRCAACGHKKEVVID